MAEPHEHEFLSLEPRTFVSDDDSASSPFDTLWTEFARSHPRLSPPQSPSARMVPRQSSLNDQKRTNERTIDLRALEYVSTYDSNLMCPICHVPFVEPTVLDCDHTFCAACFEEYTLGGPSSERSKCPSCRSYHLGSSKKASRLIRNMCNDVRVRCPNEGCNLVTARGCIVQHATKECSEELLTCPDPKCEKRTRRRNFVPEQCIHSTQVECECGAIIELGQGQWIRHRDEDCPKIVTKCERCGEPMIGKTTLNGGMGHICPQNLERNACPGREYGCTDEVQIEELESHNRACPIARLAPMLNKQSQLLQSLQEQLTMTKIRNDELETSFDRINDLLTNHIQPKLETVSAHFHDTDTDIEEIERHDLPNSATAHRDLLLPAHVRSITPSPEPEHYNNQQILQLQHLIQSHNHLEAQVTHLTQSLTDLDARSSMALMNETLRIREDLAHQNAAHYSTRAQVQWLLNRERIAGQREAMAGMSAMRGRQQNSQNQVQAQAQTQGHDPNTNTVAPGTGGSSNSSDTSPSFQASMPIPISQAQQQNQHQMSSNMSAGSSTNTSPMFNSVRPSMRRHSGGSSQERVKL